MAADALAPCVTKSSAAMVLIMQDEHVLVFHEEGFQQPAPSPFWEMMENVNISLCFCIEI